MFHKALAAGLLALLLAVPGVRAQSAAPASPVDPAAVQALKDMGAHLQSLQRFRLSTELSGERVLADGQKLQHSATAQMDVQRPNKLRARLSSARSERQLIFDGKPDDATRELLKNYGFRWSPRNSAWQRQLTANGKRAARLVMKELDARSDNPA